MLLGLTSDSGSGVGPVILQVVKLRNMSATTDAPQSTHAPRMLRLELTDGHTKCHGLEFSHNSKLDLETTAPGTKLLFPAPIQIRGSYLVIDEKVQVLNSQVDELFEQWATAKSLANHVRAGNKLAGPPPFVAYSQVERQDNAFIHDSTGTDNCVCHRPHLLQPKRALPNRMSKSKRWKRNWTMSAPKSRLRPVNVSISLNQRLLSVCTMRTFSSIFYRPCFSNSCTAILCILIRFTGNAQATASRGDECARRDSAAV